MITVYDFLDMAVDDYYEVVLFDCNAAVEDEVFAGTFQEAKSSKYQNAEVQSFEFNEAEDGNQILCLNIDTYQEDL